MIDTLAARGYSNFAFVKRHDKFEVIQLNSYQAQKGDWGNILFVHDTVFAHLAPIIDDMAAGDQTHLVEKAKWFRPEYHKRLEVIEQLRQQIE